MTPLIIIFLPAPVRAYLYCKNKLFKSFLRSRFAYSGWDAWHRAYMICHDEDKIYSPFLHLYLHVPSFFLIRHNSDAEKMFNSLENEFFIWMKEREVK